MFITIILILIFIGYGLSPSSPVQALRLRKYAGNMKEYGNICTGCGKISGLPARGEGSHFLSFEKRLKTCQYVAASSSRDTSSRYLTIDNSSG